MPKISLSTGQIAYLVKTARVPMAPEISKRRTNCDQCNEWLYPQQKFYTVWGQTFKIKLCQTCFPNMRKWRIENRVYLESYSLSYQDLEFPSRFLITSKTIEDLKSILLSKTCHPLKCYASEIADSFDEVEIERLAKGCKPQKNNTKRNFQVIEDIQAHAIAKYDEGDPFFVCTVAELAVQHSSCSLYYPFIKLGSFTYERSSRHLAAKVEIPQFTDLQPFKIDFPKEKLVLLYRDLIAGMVLRTILSIVIADNESIDKITVHAHVGNVLIIAVQAKKSQILKMNFQRQGLWELLKSLKGNCSVMPDQNVPVAPIVLGSGFVDSVTAGAPKSTETNTYSSMDLLQLDPFEFEALVGKLFKKLGFVTEVTKASGDGGIDIIASDNRPLLGGKFVIQAKRYEGKVGVPAVRDLYGTMHHEGASKGILITTSDFTAEAYKFSKGKPLELVTGAQFQKMLLDNHV